MISSLTIFQCLVVTLAIPKYKIDLDLKPFDHFKEVALAYRKDFPHIMEAWRQELHEKITQRDIKQWVEVVNFPPPYDEELEGFVHYMNSTKVTFKLLKLWNAMYELNHPIFCTGILATTENGTVVHGRNMDYGFQFEEEGKMLDLDPFTHDMEVWRDGKVLAVATGWPGHIGFHTTMRMNGYSLNANLRANTYKENFYALKNGCLPQAFLMRTIVEETADYETAVDMVYNAKFAAPSYLVMAGTKPYQGAIITVDRCGSHEVTSPPVFRLSPTKWHLVQTNDDLNDIPLDFRRPMLNTFFEMHVPADVTEYFMLKQLMVPPTYNQRTKFTEVFNPSINGHATYVFNDIITSLAVPARKPEMILEPQIIHKLKVKAKSGGGLRGGITFPEIPEKIHWRGWHEGPPPDMRGIVKQQEASRSGRV